jgi:hypothetical protein
MYKNVTAIGVNVENELFCWSTGVDLSKCKDDYAAKVACIKALIEAGLGTVPDRVMVAVNGEGSPDIVDDFNVDEDGDPS